MDSPRSRLPLVLSFLLIVCVACTSPSHSVSAGPASTPTIEVFFSPKGGATDAVVHELGNAKKEILVQAYSFTSAPIAKALVDAHKRGVKVTVVLDRSQRSERYTSATFVANSGIPTHIDAKHAIAHNKIMIIDQATIITGSFNFTKAAEEKNAENLLVIKGDTGLVEKYLANFEEHLGHSERYTGKN
jgi:Phosphatidylserine/phosphatidylglycerophosphate/cardiolipin synthases and related enzymes